MRTSPGPCVSVEREWRRRRDLYGMLVWGSNLIGGGNLQ